MFGNILVVIAVSMLSEQALAVPLTKGSSLNKSTSDMSSTRTKRDAKNLSMPEYLMSFGYIDKDAMSVSNLRSHEELKNALMTLQKIGHIPETGTMDEATVQLMKKPRCGIPDTPDGGRMKRYVHGTTRWDHKEITWNLERRTPGHLDRNSLRRDVQRAFEVWASNSSLTFREIDGDTKADIQIMFGARSHGDRHAFDGRGMILAHAFGPDKHNALGGDTHFDAEEEWTLEYNHHRGTHFFMVALHEFGHSLGLQHSDVTPSVMSPWYSGSDNSVLEQDDVVAIQMLYGRREETGRGREPTKTRQEQPRTRWEPPQVRPDPPRVRPEPPRERPEPPRARPEPPRERPEPPRGRANYPVQPPPERPSYIPSRSHPPPREPPRRPNYQPERNQPQRNYPAQQEAPSERYPERQRPDFRTTYTPPYRPSHRPVPSHNETNGGPTVSKPNIPEACDISYDAVSMLRGELFIFKDDLMWRVRVPAFEMPRDPPSPRKQLWRELPEGSIDAAYERPSGEIVFFVGRNFYVYHGTTLRDGPVPLTRLGLPHDLNKIDAVTRWKEHTFLFAGELYWKFDEERLRVDGDYPRKIVDGWTGLDKDLDAATQWKDETYFFKGKHFSRYDDERMSVQDMGRTSASYWMNCKKSSGNAIRAAISAVLLPFVLHAGRYL